MGKKFLGLGGTDHFWDRAKAWILNQITSAVAAKIAEVVANAPEDLDTLKEIADWISAHANDAAAMNTQITENKNNIATNTSDISALKTSVAGKADKLHTHSAGDIASGTLPIANGGTGATTALGAFESLANGLPEGAGPLDTEHIIFQNENRKNWGLYTLSQFWEYIKGKISSVLGLTKDNYGGRADTAGTADSAKKLNTFASWNNQYDYDATNGIRVNVYKITMASYFNSILVQIYDDINYARCRKYFLGLWHAHGYGYSVSVTDLGGTKYGGLKVWFGNDGNVYLQADVFWTSRISFSYLDDISDVTITKIGNARYGSNADINGNVLFTPLTDPITDCGALRADQNLSSASRVPQLLKTDVMTASSKMVIPIGAPSSLEDGCIWIER